MPAYRCTTCGINWPLDDMYRQCASCMEGCDAIGNSSPDGTKKEMHSLRLHFKFDRFYAALDETRGPKRLETLTEQEQALVDRCVARMERFREAALARERATIATSA